MQAFQTYFNSGKDLFCSGLITKPCILVVGSINYFSEVGISRFLQKINNDLQIIRCRDTPTLKPEVVLSSETSLSNPTARHHVSKDDNYYDDHQQEIFSIGQSLFSHKHIYGNWKLQAQFEAT